MRLKSFGCSFIFGTDLPDVYYGDRESAPIPSKHTWPAHLARHLGHSYKCYARPGAGNLQICERVLSHAANTDPSFFVIGWTWIDRFDYTNNYITDSSVLAEWQNWHTLRPNEENETSRVYYRDLHSEFRDKMSSLISIKCAIDTLKQKQIPFIMTYMDDLLFDRKWNTTAAITDLQDYVRPYMTTFDNMSFLQWSRQHNFAESTACHPLESAHQAAADYMITVFDKQKTSDPAQPVRV